MNNVVKTLQDKNASQLFIMILEVTPSSENYLNTITNLNHRIALTKLRISSHKLMIEKGRYSRPYIPPEERLCPSCQSKTEDEKHVLLYCVLYDTLRKSLKS